MDETHAIGTMPADELLGVTFEEMGDVVICAVDECPRLLRWLLDRALCHGSKNWRPEWRRLGVKTLTALGAAVPVAFVVFEALVLVPLAVFVGLAVVTTFVVFAGLVVLIALAVVFTFVVFGFGALVVSGFGALVVFCPRRSRFQCSSSSLLKSRVARSSSSSPNSRAYESSSFFAELIDTGGGCETALIGTRNRYETFLQVGWHDVL